MSTERIKWVIKWDGKKFVKIREENQLSVLKNIIQLTDKKLIAMKTTMKSPKKSDLRKKLLMNQLRLRVKRFLKYYERKSRLMLHDNNL